MELRDLTVRFGDKVVFDRANFTFPDRGVTLLSGESGVGKTTLLRALLNWYPECAFLFQEDRLLPWRRVEEHILDVMGKPDREKARAFLALVELEGEEDRYPRELSGGMRRRLALGRCLALGGRAYLLDEPFAGVDLERAERILNRIRRLDRPVILTGHTSELKTWADYEIQL